MTDVRLDQFDQFSVDLSGQVALVQIARPDKLNSMTPQFWPQLRDLLSILSADRQVHAIVLTGAGDRAFSAGGDINGFADLSDVNERRGYLLQCMQTFAAVESCRLPVIAAVNGWALGGGCELLLACDIVLAAASATFAMPEAGIGLLPGFGVQRAPSAIGRQWTKYLVFASQRIDADTALRIGLVQRVVPDEDLIGEALELGQRIAAHAPLAIEVGKQIINRDINHSELGYSVDANSLLYSTADVEEGVRAFTERRPPRFEGR